MMQSGPGAERPKHGGKWGWTFAVLGGYLLIARVLIKAVGRDDLGLLAVVMLGPALCAIGALLMLIHIENGERASRNAPTHWLLLLLLAALGWPVSCGTAVLATEGHSWIAH